MAAIASRHVIQVMHTTIRSEHPFEVVKQKLESSIPPLDERFYEFIHKGNKEKALEVLEALPPLSIFGQRDHGNLLLIANLKRHAIQYEIGNPLTASKMTRLHMRAAVYAPIRVLLSEGENGEVTFTYDPPMSIFGQFNDPRVDETASQLDHDLQMALEAVAS